MYGASPHGSAPFGSKSSRNRTPRFFTYVTTFYLAATLLGFIKDLKRVLTATLSFAGTWVKFIQRSKHTGVLVLGATIVKNAHRAFAGILTLASTFKRVIARTITGAVALAVTFVASVTRTFSATLTFVTNHFRIAIRKFTAFLTLESVNTKLREFAVYTLKISLGAFVSFTKTLFLTGVIGLGGAVSRKVNKLLSMTMTFSTTVLRTYERELTAWMTLIAEFTERSRDLYGTLTTQANYIREYTIAVVVSLTLATLSIVKTFYRTLVTVLSLVSPSRIARLHFTQVTLTFTTTITKNVMRSVTMFISAAVTKMDFLREKLFTATLTAVGTISRRARLLSGSLALTVTSIERNVAYFLAALLTATGAVKKTVVRKIVVSLALSGSIFRASVAKLFAGTLSIVVSTKKAVTRTMAAYLFFFSATSKNFFYDFASSLTVTGQLVKSMARQLTGALSLAVMYVKYVTKVLIGKMSLDTTFIRYPLSNSLVLEWYSTYQAQSYNIYYSGTPHDQGILVDNTTSTYMALPISAIDYDLVAKQEKPTDYVSPFAAGVGWFAVYPVVDGLERECLIRRAVKL
jgi:hypothetical protein